MERMDDDDASECSSVDEARPICRICYEGGGTLVRACNCKGTMEYIHSKCLSHWLRVSPAAVRKGCDVCGSAWNEELVLKPRLWQFVREMTIGERGKVALRRFLRHISNTQNIVGSLRYIDDILAGDGIDDDDDERLSHDQVAGEVLEAARNNGAWDEGDGWEAIGLLAPGGGGVEELNLAAAAIARIAVWTIFFILAVTLGRVALQLFSWGVRWTLVLDAKVDSLIIPGSLAKYLERAFPGLPCLDGSAHLRKTFETVHSSSDIEIDFLMVQKGARPKGKNFLQSLVNFFKRRGNKLDAAQRLAKDTQQQSSFVGSLTSIFSCGFTRSQASSRCVNTPFEYLPNLQVLCSAMHRLMHLGRGPWRVDDIFVGFVALALAFRFLSRLAKARSGIFAQSRHLGLLRYALLALARIALSPEAVFIDIATVFESLVSSPLAVVHCLCIFPSYVYIIRFTLARLGFLSAEAHVLDLESGDGLAFHLTLLAVAASSTTVAAALLHSLHQEYLVWVAQYALTPLRQDL